VVDVYSEDFFESHRPGSQRSARVIVPLLLELVQPRSVVDVGCGTGSWLSVFRQCGIEDVRGIDGPHVPLDSLEISADRFSTFDLTQPLRLEQHFDLVVSLEVAEHLPRESADVFVESLVRLGPIVLFSAAVPGQGGTHHVNEQWPDYWVQRFARHGYVAIDALRPEVWKADDIEAWYVQNILLFVAAERVAADARLAAAQARTRPGQLSVVHPRLFAEVSHNQRMATEAYTAVAAEAAENRTKAERFFAELEQLKVEVNRHRATAERYMAQSVEDRAKAEAFFAELEQLKAEATRHRATAEHYMAQSVEDRAKAEAFFAELEQLEDEAARHRSTAEHYMAESAERGRQAEFYYGESARLRAELTAASAETEHWRRRADPRTASLRRVLRELPTVVASALKRRLRRRRDAAGLTE
jgi:SAM-dependent methyltransferase